MPIDYREVMRLCRAGRRGDAMELLAKHKETHAHAVAMKKGCLDADGKLKPESGCAKQKDRLNGWPEGKTPVDKQA